MNAVRRIAAGTAVLAIPLLLWLIAGNPPTSGGWYPPCLFNVATGLHCPGCGGTRSLHLLLNGDVAGAVHQNALMLAALPLVGWYLVAMSIYALRGKWVGPNLNGARLAGAVAILVIGFGIVRNIPGLEMLAPKPLAVDPRE